MDVLLADRDLTYGLTTRQSTGVYPAVTTVRIKGAPLTDEFASELRNRLMQANPKVRATSEVRGNTLHLRLMSPGLATSNLRIHCRYMGMIVAKQARMILRGDPAPV